MTTPRDPHDDAGPVSFFEPLEPRVLLSGDVVYRVNAGGDEVAGTPVWEDDKPAISYVNQPTSGSATFGNPTPVTLDGSVPVGTPTDIFQRFRYDPGQLDEMQWDFPVAPDLYEVRLYFAELDDDVTAAGQTVFDVSIEGQLVLDDFDVFAESGGILTGIMRSFTVQSDANLDIDFDRLVENPYINGIEILSVIQPDTLGADVTALDFGLTEIGTPGNLAVTLKNLGTTGDPAITLGTATVTAGDFTDFTLDDVSGQVLQPGDTLVVNATYDPAAEGLDSATVELAHSGVNTPLALAFAGEAVTEIINTAPTIDAIANQALLEGDTLSIPIQAQDVDGHTLALSATLSGGAALPAFISVVDNGDGTGTVELQPQLGDAAVFTGIEVTVTEVGTPELLSATTMFDLEVAEAPDPSLIVYRVNAGGNGVSGNPEWEDDKPALPYTNREASGSSTYSSPTPVVFDATVPIGTPEQIFKSYRDDPQQLEEMQWDFAVTPGMYEVRLYFAAIFEPENFGGADVFDVFIENAVALQDFDIFSEVGGYTGTMRSFIVDADGNLDIDFFHGNSGDPLISGFEIIQVEPTVALGTEVEGLFVDGINFGTVQLPGPSIKTASVTHLGTTGDAAITIQSTTITGDTEFTDNFDDLTPVVLQPGQSFDIDVAYAPAATTTNAATLTVEYTVDGDPQVRTLVLSLDAVATDAAPIGFGKSTLANVNNTSNPTSLQFGPDGRLYVGHQDGTINVYTITRNAANDYAVTAAETIDLVYNIPNHNDVGVPDPVEGRLMTGIYVAGTSVNPVIYTISSDPRGGSGGNANVDTNSGILSRLTWTGAAWEKVDLVRGLPRSEELHGGNGMEYDANTNTLYLAYGGNTNAGAPSSNFGYLSEYAYSAAILSFDLDALDALPTQLDPVNPDVDGDTFDDNFFKYDLPTLDDEDRDFDGFGSDVDLTAGIQDVFGGNNGKNQAKLELNGPVQVYSPGWRNPYDLVIHSNGNFYTIDNGANGGWGGAPVIDDNGTPGDPSDDFPTNAPVDGGGIATEDNLQVIPNPGFYGGSPNPVRATHNITFNPTNPQSPTIDVPENPAEAYFTVPQTVGEGALVTFDTSTNGLVEYTATNFGSAMQGDLLAASFFGGNTIWRLRLDPSGQNVLLKQPLFTSVGAAPLDVTALGDDGPFPGTVWTGDWATNQIVVFEPADFDGGGGTGDPNDLDGDGYSNDDENANGTDPNNAGSIPSDNDGDFLSDLLDDDDDNDTVFDVDDAFAIDDTNGLNTGVVRYDFTNADNGFFQLGFTGLMLDDTNTWQELLQLDQSSSTGGAGQVLTIGNIDAGTAVGSANTQLNAFQFGVNPTLINDTFTVTTRLITPFFDNPLPGQEMGLYVGDGTQSNFVQLVLSGDAGGQVQFGDEFGDVVISSQTQPLNMVDIDYVDLILTVDPVAETVSAAYVVSRNGSLETRVDLPASVSVPMSWVDGSAALAAGIRASASGTPFDATWDFIEVDADQANQLGVDVASLDFGTVAPAQTTVRSVVLTNLGDGTDPDITLDPIQLTGDTDAFTLILPSATPIVLAPGQSVTVDVQFNPLTEASFTGDLAITHTGIGGSVSISLAGLGAVPNTAGRLVIQPGTTNIKRASTFGTQSFRLFNDSTDGSNITRVTIDLSTAILTDSVFDPDGLAGDTDGRDLVSGGGSVETGFAGHTLLSPHDGGYDAVEIDFTDFNPGESFLFGLDVDPTSVKGSEPPGPEHAASVSGTELSGATVTIEFSDGSILTSYTYPVPGTQHASQATINADVPAAPTGIEAVGLILEALSPGRSGTVVGDPNQTIRVFGQVGETVSLLRLEAGLFLEDVPNGGFDIDLLESNSIVAIDEWTDVIGAGGFVDFAITLTDTSPLDIAGFNMFTAVVNEGGVTGAPTDVIVIKYDDTPDYDFGDAAATYGTLLADDGARHLRPSGAASEPASPALGPSVDTEADGLPTAGADGDDLDAGDDEDGLAGATLVAGGASQIDVTVTGSGFLDAWLDLNQDGDFLDADEHVLDAVFVTGGLNTLPVTVPVSALDGSTVLRLRLSNEAAGVGPTGLVVGGEVEDHLVTVTGGADGVAPTVTGVYVSGSLWSPDFLNTIDPATGQGYLASNGVDQLLALPWANLDRVSIVFDEDVTVGQNDLVISGVNASYTFSAFSYDSPTRTAMWTLDAPIGVDKLRLDLADTVTDLAGNALDGEWTDGVSTASGNGTTGGSLSMRLNVLPGDTVNSASPIVLGNDLIYVRDRLGETFNDAGFSVWADLNGDGSISNDDLNLVRSAQFSRLPGGEP